MASRKLILSIFGVSLLGIFLAATPIHASFRTDVDIKYLGEKRGPDPSVFETLKDEDAAGLIISLKGRAFIINYLKESKPAAIKASVLLGDTVRTERDSTLKIAFLDQSVLSLAGDTEVVIKNFVFNPLASNGASVVKVRKGTFSFYAGKLARIKPENYKVETDMATVGIRGSAGHGRLDIDGNGIPYLDITTVEGHVLVVSNRRGEVRLLENPRVGIRVYTGGLMVPIAIYPGYFEQNNQGWTLPYPDGTLNQQQPSQGSLETRALLQVFAVRWQDSQGIVGLRRRESLTEKVEAMAKRKLKEAGSQKKVSKKLHDIKVQEFTLRDVEDENFREKASTTPTMQRLAQQQRQDHEVKEKKGDNALPNEQTNLRKTNVAKEKSTSMNILHRLGTEIHEKVKQENRVKQPHDNDELTPSS